MAIQADQQLIRGTAGRLLPGGEAVVRVGGESLLVANAVPGDLLDIRPDSRRRGVQRGQIVRVVEPSPLRVPPICPVADRCGGCALQFLAPAEQAKLKSEWVSHAFRDLMQSDSQWLPIEADEVGLRRRVRWMVGHDADGPFLGFYAPVSHNPVWQQSCPVLTPELNALQRMISGKLRQLEVEKGSLNGLSAVQAVQLSDGIHLILEAEAAPVSPDVAEIESLPLQWWWRDAAGITRPMQKPALCLHDILPAGTATVSLAVGPDDFVQGQLEGNRALIVQVQTWAGKVKRIADLFCGIGNLSLPLAAATGAELNGAELNAASVRAAQANAKRLGLKARFYEANLFENFDLEPFIGADLLILDPPRRGARRLCSQIHRLLPERIVMISCDAAAGARDGALLAEQGYRLAALRALDLFPYAGHVEAMSLWLRE